MEEVYKLLEMDGPHGRFGIARAGGLGPEALHCFLYQDETMRFFFCADRIWRSERENDIVVKSAHVDKMRGGYPLIPESKRRHVIDNIRMFFSARDFLFVEREVKDNRPDDVSFTWRVGP